MIPPVEPFKHEITVDLYGENYLIVSCSLNEQFYAGILLRSAPSLENADVLRKLADGDRDVGGENGGGGDRRCLVRYDQQKISSLCFRRTSYSDAGDVRKNRAVDDAENADDGNPFRLLQNQKPAKGIRRSDSGSTVRLRPVPIQRNQNGVRLCSRCQNECETSKKTSTASKNRSTCLGRTSANKTNISSRKRPNLQTIFDKILQNKKFKKSDFFDRQILPDLNHTYKKIIDNPPPSWKISKNYSTKQPAVAENVAQPPIPKLKIKLNGGGGGVASTSAAVAEASPAAEPPTVAEAPPKAHFLRKDSIVWAKMRSYPYWPAKIFDLQQNFACVVWAASLQYGYVDLDVLEPFLENFRKRYNAKRNVSYQKAVADALAECRNADDSAAVVDRLPLAPSCRKLLSQFSRARQFKTCQRNVKIKSEIFRDDDDYASGGDFSATSNVNEIASAEDEVFTTPAVKLVVVKEEMKTVEEKTPKIDEISTFSEKIIDEKKSTSTKEMDDDFRPTATSNGPPKKLIMRTLSHDFSRKNAFKNRFLARTGRDLLKINRPTSMLDDFSTSKANLKRKNIDFMKNSVVGCKKSQISVIADTLPQTPVIKIPTNHLTTTTKPRLQEKNAPKTASSPRPLLKSPPKMPLKMTVKNLDVYKNRLPKSPPPAAVDVSKIFQPLTLKNCNFSIPKRSTAPTLKISAPPPTENVTVVASSPRSLSPCDSPRLVIDEEESTVSVAAVGVSLQTSTAAVNKKPAADDFDNVLSKLREMNELCENSSSSCSSTVSH